MQETQVQSLGREDPLVEKVATHSSILAGKIPWIEEPGRLQFMGLQDPTLCDPMDYTVHGILQARILEWVVFPFSRGSSQPRD